MTDKIESGCLAEPLTFRGASWSPPAIVRVGHRESADYVLYLESVATGHARKQFSEAIRRFGPECFWHIEFEEGRYPPSVFPEPLLRRLPPPDVDQFTERKDASVPA